ncbi:lipopolysaccharide biosynthesis protein [Butyrivibrio sp. FC2001]|uniref:lipopolysaccharide biosynthesis protein n=1 Tax=Butyrivibrio sp. FC2001 TaxID=1280671 RepID=UPI00040960F2|nr:oligosaccharide flippase family protein [Butyrivibrio sp. FC2001]
MMSDLKSMLKHFLAISIGTIFNMIIGVVSVPIITRLVDTGTYGSLSLFNLYSDILVMVLCLGLDQAYVRFYYAKEGVGYKACLLKYCYSLSIFVALIVSAIFVFIVFVLGITIGFSFFFILSLAIYVLIGLTSRFSFLTLRLEYDSKTYSLLNVIHRFLFALLAVAILSLRTREKFETLVLCTIISLLIPMIISIYLKRNIWMCKKNDQVIIGKEVLAYGLPFIFSIGIVTLFNGIDRLTLNAFSGTKEVGVYASAQELLKVFAIIQTSFNIIWKPYAMERHEKKPKDKDHYAQIFDFACALMFLFGITIILGKDFFALILGEKYREAAFVIPCLCFYPMMYTISEISSVGIDFSKKSSNHIWVAAISCIVNIVGNAALVPILGGKGAAISTGVSYIVFFSLRTFFSVKAYGMIFRLHKVTIVIFLSFMYALYSTFNTVNIFGLLAYCLNVCVILILYWKQISLAYLHVLAFIGRGKS